MGTPALATLDEPGKRWLLAVAAPSEARAVCRGLGADATGDAAYWQATPLSARISVLLTGVGKANASGAVAAAFDPAAHIGVINLGIAGALPGSGLAPLDRVLASLSVFADEGSETSQGFTDIAAMGFAPGAGVLGLDTSVAFAPTERLALLLRPLCATAGPVATVSTCAGTDERANEVARRTGGVAEAMEGAAAALSLARRTGGRGLFAEVRIISNTTGDRARQTWRLRDALDNLGELASLL